MMRKLLFIVFAAGLVAALPVAFDAKPDVLQPESKSIVAHAQTPNKCINNNSTKDSCSLAQRIAAEDGFVYDSWKTVRSIINILLIIGLLAISFSNITHNFLGINLESYTIKKALPRLLLGIVLANASLFIIRYMADIASVVTYFFVEQTDAATGTVKTFDWFIGQVMAKIGLEGIINGTRFALPGPSQAGSSILILLIMGIIIAIGALWLAIILYIRLAMIYILTILSPLAFIAYGVPGAEKYFRTWWQQFLKWLFILPAMAAVFWFMLEISKSGSGSLIQVVISYILFFMALTIPTRFGGKIISMANGYMKNAGAMAYKGSQAGGANVGLMGMNLEARGKALATQAKNARAEALALRRRGDRPGALNKRLEANALEREGLRLQRKGGKVKKVGKFLVTPTAIQQGYKSKVEAQRKGREVFVEGTGLYERLAGPDVVYANKRKKAKDEFDGLSHTVLAEKLQEKLFDKKGNPTALGQKLLSLDKDTRNKILLGSPFTASSTAKNFGFGDGDMGDLAEIAELYKQHGIDFRRSRKKSDFGLDFFKPGGNAVFRPPVGGMRGINWPGGGGGGNNPGGPGNNPGGGGTGGGGGGPTPPAGGAGGINWPGGGGGSTPSSGPTLGPSSPGPSSPSTPPPNNFSFQPQDLEVHVDHFKTSFGPEASRDLAKLGAQIHEELNDAIEAGGEDGINQALNKAHDFFANAGYPKIVPPNPGEASQQGLEMLNKVAKVSQAAEAASRNLDHQTAASLDNLHARTGEQLSQLVPNDPDPAERARSFAENPQVNQTITNHITQQANLLGSQLNQQQIQDITKSLSERLITDITSKRTLNRIFNSEQFRQNLNDTITTQASAPTTMTTEVTEPSAGPAEPPPGDQPEEPLEP